MNVGPVLHIHIYMFLRSAAIKGNFIPGEMRECRQIESECILTCDWAPVVIPGNPSEANTAGGWV